VGGRAEPGVVTSGGRPVLVTARLALYEMTTADLDDMAALLGDPEVMTYYPRPKSRDEALAWIEWNRELYREFGFGLWLVRLRDSGVFIGDCGLTWQHVDGDRELEVGYHVRRAVQRGGYASEAAAAALAYARDVGAQRLVALVHPRNRASQRVAEKIGLRLERRTRDGSGRPVVVYSAAL
jgi:RimJ/RimL family protein N-acetyltransferase